MKLKLTLVFLVLAAGFVYLMLDGRYISFSPKTESAVGNPAAPDSRQILDKLYSLDLRNYTGDKVRFKAGELEGGPALIVHLWASWCAPCVNEVPELIAFAKRHPEVKFVAVSLDQYQDDIAKFMKSFPDFNGPRFFKIWDGDNSISKFINADRLPMTVILRAGRPEPQVVQAAVEWKYLEL